MVFLRRFLVAGAVLLSVAAARADFSCGTFSHGISSVFFSSSFARYAVPFIPLDGVPDGQTFSVDSVRLSIMAPLDYLNVYIADDDGFGLPGFTLGTVDPADNGTTWGGDTSFSLSPPAIEVTEGTQYWLVVSSGGGATAFWNLNDGGDTGLYGVSDAEAWSSLSGTLPAFNVSGSNAVPEPASLGLLALAGCAAMASRRRRAA